VLLLLLLLLVFAQAHSPDRSDLLPGLYMLSQAWLQEAVLGGFRPDAAEGQEAGDLGLWFAAGRVQLYIQAGGWQQQLEPADECRSFL
jgi:hypothetical protein